MKKLLFIPLAIFILSFTACGDDDGLVGADAGSGKVTATVDGQSWESKDEVSGAVYAETQGTHQLQAYHDDGSYLGMTFFGTITSGTTIDGTGGLFQAQYKPEFMGSEVFTSVQQGGSGTITFTTFNESKVKGTFEFTGIRANPDGSLTSLQVSSGSFDINL